MNVLVMISYIHIYMYVYMKCILTNDFMRSESPDLVHRRVELGGATPSTLMSTGMGVANPKFSKGGTKLKKTKYCIVS